MTSIGHVCLQWALLEHTILTLLAAIENIHIDEAALLLAGLDMRQRLCKSIDLAEYRKIQPHLIKRLRGLRTGIDKQKLVERRNRAVHGVQKKSERPRHFVFSMPRLKGLARDAHWTVADVYLLSMEIQAAGAEVTSIFQDFGTWKFGEHRAENEIGDFVAGKPGVWTRLKQNLRARRDHTRRYLYLLRLWP